MSINYNPLGHSYLDANEFPALMQAFEGYINSAYDDGIHIASIGIGVNLTNSTYLARVLAEFNVFTVSDAAEASRRAQMHLPAETTAERNIRSM
ncbi:MAG TPA: hypothetical protein PKM41_07650 [Deltaproteobacteria bacterium]|nr:hypothetical protein [Deltaproteobacteria bacterium]HOI06913.1 hypothetical protein [Deltaproteobacteria bacterium]